MTAHREVLFVIQSDNLGLLTGVFQAFTFNVVIDRVRFNLSPCYLFLLSHQSFVPFHLFLAPFFFFFFFFFFLGPYLQHMEVPRLGVHLELQLLAYTTATATSDLSHVCKLHHSSQQRQILNPLSEARD